MKYIRWCPGCGNYIILKNINYILKYKLKIKKKNIIFISGIGCSSRIVHYLNYFSINGTHGRSAAIATGIYLTNNYIKILIISGDGDTLSIGLNHFIYLIINNINLIYLMINNYVYALTKGQRNNIVLKINILLLLLTLKCKFIARVYDNNINEFYKIFTKIFFYKGFSFIEIIQYCPLFNKNIINYNNIFLLKNKKIIKNNKYFLIYKKYKIYKINIKFLKKKEYKKYVFIHDIKNYYKVFLLLNFFFKENLLYIGIIYNII
ncbi:MAG: thiamine pyrophosphate-dependent enzyme [Candidatus Shikimatogenerans sp. Tcar]|uniref:Thiamine pyrophosphate-dependent enzyme n=1 Tax=Candidatus Shikimatogenerans sp. Tcar TaxID=3158565 RepID=A0AAU7QSK3_9FLAO